MRLGVYLKFIRGFILIIGKGFRYNFAFVLLSLVLLAGCGTTKSSTPNSEAASFPEGILHYGTFEPGNPLRCAYLDRPRQSLSPEAETWLVEHKIGEAGFPISLYGENTPSWAKGRTVYVYCEDE